MVPPTGQPQTWMPATAARELSKRAELAGPDPAGAAARFAALATVFAAVTWMMLNTGSIPLKLVAAFINGLLLFGVAIGGHEAVHKSLSPSRLVNDLAGIVWMSSLVVPYATYARLHVEHHAFVRTDQDPEGDFHYKSLLAYVLVAPISGLAFVALLWSETILTFLGRGRYVRTTRQRRRIVLQGLASVVIVTALIGSTVAFPVMRWVWMAPMLTAALFWAPLVLTPEHYALNPGHPGAATRTTVTNPLVRAALWNVNYHAAHHVSPLVPARRLPTFHELVTADGHTTSGYLRFQADIIGSLIRRDPMLPDK